MKDLSSWGNVKICVSSRPEPEYIFAFQQCRQLRLQDLTRNDMHEYVQGTLAEAPRWQTIHDEDAVKGIDFQNEIVEKGDGVFLWIRLVVHDMVAGINRGDSLSDLKKRLQETNRTLDGLSEQLVKRVHSIHRKSSAKYLKMLFLQETCSFQWCLFSFLVASDLNIRAKLEWDVKENTNWEKLEKRLLDIELHLTARCAGLVTVDWLCTGMNAQEEQNIQHSSVAHLCFYYCQNSSINLVHRSARDFLLKSECGKKFLLEADCDDEHIVRSTVQSFETCMNTVGPLTFELADDPAGKIRYWGLGIVCLLAASENLGINLNKDFDHLDDALTRASSRQLQSNPEQPQYWVLKTLNLELSDGYTATHLAGLATERGLIEYPYYKLQECSVESQSRMATQLLHCIPFLHFQPTTLSFIKNLFKHGADPLDFSLSSSDVSCSTWSSFINNVQMMLFEDWRVTTGDEVRWVREGLEIFFAHGCTVSDWRFYWRGLLGLETYVIAYGDDKVDLRYARDASSLTSWLKILLERLEAKERTGTADDISPKDYLPLVNAEIRVTNIDLSVDAFPRQINGLLRPGFEVLGSECAPYGRVDVYCTLDQGKRLGYLLQNSLKFPGEGPERTAADEALFKESSDVLKEQIPKLMDLGIQYPTMEQIYDAYLTQ